MSGHPYDLYLFQYNYGSGIRGISESLRIISYNIHIQEYYKQTPCRLFNESNYSLKSNLTNWDLNFLKKENPAITVTKYQIRLPNKIFNENDLKFNPNTGKFGILDIATKIE
jgi:hypothetical protein